MKVKFSNDSIFLFIGIFIMVMTMVLHPAGGGFEKLSKDPFLAILSHSLATFSIPFVGLGFFGLSKLLGFNKFFPKLGFGILIIGLIAIMIAGTLNGIVQPIYAMKYANESAEFIEGLKPIFAYNRALNMAFDYIIIGAFLLSTLCWSISILKGDFFPKLIGWFGLSLVAAAGILLLLDFSFITLFGLRIFIFSWVIWIFFVAFYMSKIQDKS